MPAPLSSFCLYLPLLLLFIRLGRRVKVRSEGYEQDSATILLLVYPGARARSASPTSVPNMFAPESQARTLDSPDLRFSYWRLQDDVRAGGWSAHLRHRSFPTPANDDGTEPAQVYGSGPVEAAWTTVPFLIVLVLTLDHRTGDSGRAGRSQTCLGAGCAGHRASVVVGDSLSQARHRHRQ